MPGCLKRLKSCAYRCWYEIVQSWGLPWTMTWCSVSGICQRSVLITPIKKDLQPDIEGIWVYQTLRAGMFVGRRLMQKSVSFQYAFLSPHTLWRSISCHSQVYFLFFCSWKLQPICKHHQKKNAVMFGNNGTAYIHSTCHPQHSFPNCWREY